MLSKSLILSIILLLNISNFVLAGGDVEICLVIGGYCQDSHTDPDYYYDMPSGTLCINNTVVQYTKIGGNCTTLSCDSDYATCDNGICVLEPWAQIGEKCSNDEECDNGICNLGLCELETGRNCTDDSLCKVSEWCNGTVCTPRAQKGESCENNDCSLDTFCDDMQSNLCKPYFTLEEGDGCDSNIECNYANGLECKEDICKKQNLTKLDNCVTSSDSCYGDLQYCSINTTKCETKTFINTACKNTYTSYYSCIVKNNCHDFDGVPSPAGCIMKNCGYDYCQITKSCRTSYCGMNYNAYICDSFLPKKETEEPSKASILTISKFLIPIFIFVLLF